MSSTSLRRQILRDRPPAPAPVTPGTQKDTSYDPNHTPLSWEEFFTSKETVVVENDTFRVYKLFDAARANDDSIGTLILLHGGGFSGLTWSRLASLISHDFYCETYAIDLRGHGETRTKDEYDLSMATLSKDVVNIIQKLNLTNRKLVLMGHSMGGALAVNVALQLEDSNPVSAIVVYDVVEGSAMESLKNMPSFLRTRPSGFNTVSSAIKWSLRSCHTKDNISTRVSIPGQLKLAATNQPVSELLHDLHEEESGPTASRISTESAHKIVEEEEEEVAGPSSQVPIEKVFEKEVKESPSASTDALAPSKSEDGSHQLDESVSSISTRATMGSNSKETLTMSSSFTSIIPLPGDAFLRPDELKPYTWRIDLMRTEQHWMGWFDGLSKKFLAVSCPKLLMIAGVERLDKELMVAQMQGKFELQIMASVGHVIHEDDPVGAAALVAKFLTRHRLITAKSPV